MRCKEYKKLHKKYNINKVKNILNKANCIFVCLTDKELKKLDVNGIAKYVMFNDKIYNSTYIIEYKKLGIDNILNIVNK